MCVNRVFFADQVTGGTSASAPEWAGVIALLNDIRIGKRLPLLGFVNTRLYAQVCGDWMWLFGLFWPYCRL